MKFFIILIAILVSGFFAVAGTEVYADIQTEIIDAYSKDQCEQVRKLIENQSQKIDPKEFRTNVMAIVAFCSASEEEAEKLFENAEKLNPTGDLILVLHALYRSQKSEAAASPLWQKVLMIARNEYFRELAQEHLARVVSKKVPPLDLSSSTGFGEVFIGGIHRSNPRPDELSFQPRKSSYGSEVSGDFSYRRWYPFGSIAAQWATSYDQYFQDSSSNFLKSNLDIPLAMHVAPAKDLIFTPILGYTNLSGKTFGFSYGLGMKGAVYQSAYVQSVQAIFYADRIFEPNVAPTQGAHYRFEYAWDFYPRHWLVETLLAVEHVSGSSVNQFLGSSGQFEMSHNDFSFEFRFERNFSKYILSAAPKLKYRLDTETSIYTKPGTTQPIHKQRADWESSFHFSASVPMMTATQLFAWYEWKQRWSNLGASDYVNRNFVNHTVGLGLKVFLSTY